MKPRVYLWIALLLLPIQATLMEIVSVQGVKPDIGLVVVFLIGMLTSPLEGALAGIGIGLMQDIGSAGIVGLGAMLRGGVGLASGILGSKVFDLWNPAVVIFLCLFSIVEGISIAFFLNIIYGPAPLWQLIAELVPRALYTTLAGYFMLRIVSRRSVLQAIRRRWIEKDSA